MVVEVAVGYCANDYWRRAGLGDECARSYRPSLATGYCDVRYRSVEYVPDERRTLPLDGVFSGVLGDRAAAEFQVPIRATEHFGILGAMEYDYSAGMPRLPILQPVGVQKSKHVFELANRIPRGWTVAFDRVVLGHLGPAARNR